MWLPPRSRYAPAGRRRCGAGPVRQPDWRIPAKLSWRRLKFGLGSLQQCFAALSGDSELMKTLPCVKHICDVFKPQPFKTSSAQPTGREQDTDSLNAECSAAAHEVMKNLASLSPVFWEKNQSEIGLPIFLLKTTPACKLAIHSDC